MVRWKRPFTVYLFMNGEVVKKLGQAPRSYAKSLQNTDIRSEPVPFCHNLGRKARPAGHYLPVYLRMRSAHWPLALVMNSIASRTAPWPPGNLVT